VATAVAIVTFVLVWVGHAPPEVRSDWDFYYLGARGIIHGMNPYRAVEAAVQRGEVKLPLFYPATAPLLLAPLGALPSRFGVSLFSAGGMFALALSARERWQWGLLASAPAMNAVLLGQWSPLLVAGIGLPALAISWAAKPTVGLALFAGWPSRTALLSGLALTLLALVLFPSWPWDWRAAVAGSPNYLAPIQRPGGFLLLLGLLRWRAPEGRLLGVLALVPHTTALHDMLAPLLAARTGRELVVLVVLGYLFAVLAYSFTPHGPDVVPQMLAAQWPVALSLVYIPALVLVLRRPNTLPERDLADD
jgi:hypothetical protein